LLLSYSFNLGDSIYRKAAWTFLLSKIVFLSNAQAMRRTSTKTGNAFSPQETKSIEFVHLRPVLVEEIHRLHPETRELKSVPEEFVTEARTAYVQSVLENDMGELSAIEEQVVRSLAEHELISHNLDEDFAEQRKLGERIADQVAAFGGSWTFIGLFALVLITWILINVLWLGVHAFDPYPFILMNLILSCLAALQAPIIMMSQKRAEARDRVRAVNDYKVNLKAELEIRHLHEKVDYLLHQQHKRLIEIQTIQLDLLSELAAKQSKAGIQKPRA
jgi:uncharacterized membrane protein